MSDYTAAAGRFHRCGDPNVRARERRPQLLALLDADSDQWRLRIDRQCDSPRAGRRQVTRRRRWCDGLPARTKCNGTPDSRSIRKSWRALMPSCILPARTISGRWSEKFKREVRESRVLGTRTLATAAAESFRRTGSPRILVAASAIGYYGNRGDEELTEDSAPGSGFLAEVCEEWEAAAHPAAEAGVRVVNLRIGVVLAKHGGALQGNASGVSPGLGRPDRRRSPVHELDRTGRSSSAHSCSRSPTIDLQGPVNAVAPQPVRNSEFVRALGKVLHRPAIFPLPAFVVRTVFGEMGEALLLGSARVRPAKLEAAGYSFRHSELGGSPASGPKSILSSEARFGVSQHCSPR